MLVVDDNSPDGTGQLVKDLAGDYPRWTAAQAICETAERLTPEEREPAAAQFQLLVAGLRALAQREHAPGLVLDAYLVRSLAIAGWAASFDACARCGEAGPHRAFSLPGGGALCADCRIPGSATPRPATMELLGALLSGDWAVADASDDRSRREASEPTNWRAMPSLKPSSPTTVYRVPS